MLAFHNNQSIKDKYVARVRGHMEADELVRGTGWDGSRGCAVGCTLEAYEHDRYETELGIPEWLARLEDTLFENISIAKSETWPLDFLQAAKPGADLEKVKTPFLIFVLQRALTRFDHAKFPECAAAVNGSIALWRRDDIGSDDWSAARLAVESAARSAARSAESVARSAESVARSAAWSAAWSAESAARSAVWSAAELAAESAARAAARAARSAVELAEYDIFADELLRLIGTA